MSEKFNLEFQYQLYLERCCLRESEMNTIQKVETKRAFMGGCGQMLVVLRDDITEIPNEDDAANILQIMLDDVNAFFMIEVLKYNLPQN